MYGTHIAATAMPFLKIVNTKQVGEEIQILQRKRGGRKRREESKRRKKGIFL